MSPRTSKQFEELRKSSKENIIRSALTLFSSHGFFNTSIRQIAKQAGISVGLLYNYFKSKEELLTEIVTNSFETMGEEEETREKTGSRYIEQVIRRFFQLLRTRQDMLRMMVQLGLQSKKFVFVNALLRKKYDHQILKLKEHLSVSESGKYQWEAHLLMATMDGILFQLLVLGDTVPLEEMEAALVEKYLEK